MNGPSTNGFAGHVLRGAPDVAPDGVVITEAEEERLVVSVTPACCRGAGYATREWRGKRLRTLQGADAVQRERGGLRETRRHGETRRALLRNQRKDGTVFVNDM